MEKSLAITRALPSSPGNDWILHVTEVHLAALSDDTSVESMHLVAAEPLLQEVRALTSEIGTLRAYRAISPY